MCVFSRKIANSDAEALREIYTTVKIKITCLFCDILCHFIIFIMYEEFRFKNLSKGWNVERSGKVVYLLVIFETSNTKCWLSKVLVHPQVCCYIFKMYFTFIQVVYQWLFLQPTTFEWKFLIILSLVLLFDKIRDI